MDNPDRASPSLFAGRASSASRSSGRRIRLRYRLAGPLLMALVMSAAPALRFTSFIGFDLATRPALADDGGGHDGGGDGGGGGGEGGGSGSGSSGSDDSSGGGSEGGDDSGGDDGGGSGAGGSDHTRHAVAHELVAIGPTDGLNAALASLGMHVIEETSLAALDLKAVRIGLPAQMSLDTGKALLQARLPSLQIDVNALYQPMASLTLPAPGDPARMVGWPSPASRCGVGLRVGMIDTGIDATAPSLGGHRIHQQSFLAAGQSAAPTDHGTAIAGLLVGAAAETASLGTSDLKGAASTAAPAEGLLPQAELYAAAVFAGDAKGGASASAIGFARALDWMVGAGIRAINVSLAGDDNLLIDLAVARAAERGAVLVAAAGNGGPTAPPAYPAALEPVIAVTAVDIDGRPYDQANRGDYIDVAAPGVRVVSPATGPETGTSFAAPFVTAWVAAKIAEGGPADAAALHRAIAAGARDLGPAGHDPEFGWGLLQADGRCG